MGSLSSKQKLKGLVTIKKKTALPVVTFGTTSTTSKSVPVSSSSTASLETAESSSSKAQDRDVESSSDARKDTTKNSSTLSNLDASNSEVQIVGTSGTSGKSNALSLLGAYPDSESDSNTSD